MLKLFYDPAYGAEYKWLPVPPQKYFWNVSNFDPLSIYAPSRYRYWFPHYWPTHLLEYIPTYDSLRQIRVSLSKRYV